jgi:hypothetical protein
MCTLHCGHFFHYDCISKWVEQQQQRNDTLVTTTCPYCRRCVMMSNVPTAYDCFYQFYYYTRFVRKKCCKQDCPRSEFPLNSGLCSVHQYPSIDRHDLSVIMENIFCFHFLPLKIKKMLLYFAVTCYDDEIDFVSEFAALKDSLLNYVLSISQHPYEDPQEGTRQLSLAIEEYCKGRGVAIHAFHV